MSTPERIKLSGLIVVMSVGEVFFPSENAFQKFWNAQTDEVKANLRTNDNPDSVSASNMVLEGKAIDPDSQSDNQP